MEELAEQLMVPLPSGKNVRVEYLLCRCWRRL
jgi:hypothetical protein